MNRSTINLKNITKLTFYPIEKADAIYTQRELMTLNGDTIKNRKENCKKSYNKYIYIYLDKSN